MFLRLWLSWFCPLSVLDPPRWIFEGRLHMAAMCDGRQECSAANLRTEAVVVEGP